MSIAQARRATDVILESLWTTNGSPGDRRSQAEGLLRRSSCSELHNRGVTHRATVFSGRRRPDATLPKESRMVYMERLQGDKAWDRTTRLRL